MHASGQMYGQYGTPSASLPLDRPIKPRTRMPFSKYVGKVPTSRQGARLNEVPILLSMFVPWLIFSLVVTMLSFSMHFHSPRLCEAICIVVGAITGVSSLYYIVQCMRSWFYLNEDGDDPTWPCFMSTTAVIALVVAVVIGNQNYYTNMQPFLDLDMLNTYKSVDPSRTRGVELMDAGVVNFVSGTKLDLGKSAGFKNVDTYCVAPIAGGAVVGKPPLASYDFWAVGKNCCSGNGEADFKCDDYDKSTASSGMRLVRDEDRSFYRLAIQQAQSTHNIKSIHPIFFKWVEDPQLEKQQKQRDAYRYTFISVLIFFGAQFAMVFSLAWYFFNKSSR